MPGHPLRMSRLSSRAQMPVSGACFDCAEKSATATRRRQVRWRCATVRNRINPTFAPVVPDENSLRGSSLVITFCTSRGCAICSHVGLSSSRGLCSWMRVMSAGTGALQASVDRGNQPGQTRQDEKVAMMIIMMKNIRPGDLETGDSECAILVLLDQRASIVQGMRRSALCMLLYSLIPERNSPLGPQRDL